MTRRAAGVASYDFFGRPIFSWSPSRIARFQVEAERVETHVNWRFFNRPASSSREVPVPHRATVGGPTFIRLLARLADVDVAPSSQSLSDRLSQWLDWNRALALSSALDDPPAPADTGAPAGEHLQAECARAREELIAGIRSDPVLAPIREHTVAVDESRTHDGKPADFGVFRQCYLARQRAMQSTTGRLRGELRTALAQTSADMAQLAAVDAVMEQALSPREHALLANVPGLLANRFERLRESASPVWLDTFRRDMRSVLLAEFELRFQPVDGLLAALRTH